MESFCVLLRNHSTFHDCYAFPSGNYRTPMVLINNIAPILRLNIFYSVKYIIACEKKYIYPFFSWCLDKFKFSREFA